MFGRCWVSNMFSTARVEEDFTIGVYGLHYCGECVLGMLSFYFVRIHPHTMKYVLKKGHRSQSYTRNKRIKKTQHPKAFGKQPNTAQWFCGGTNRFTQVCVSARPGRHLPEASMPAQKLELNNLRRCARCRNLHRPIAELERLRGPQLDRQGSNSK